MVEYNYSVFYETPTWRAQNYQQQKKGKIKKRSNLQFINDM